MSTVITQILHFIVLVLLQVLLLNNIQFLGAVNPYIYILFIFSLPLKTQKWLSLVLAFVLGLVIDTFSNTMGLHAFATVLIAFLREPVIKLFVSSPDDLNNTTPSINTFGIGAYTKYVFLLVLFHHTVLFLLEAFSFSFIVLVLVKIAISSLVTSLIIISIQLLQQKIKR